MWDTVAAMIEMGLDLCGSQQEIDAYFADPTNRRTINEMGRARPDLWNRIGRAAKQRRQTLLTAPPPRPIE